MAPRLSGRTVLISGAASGIGRASALRIAAEGAAVAAIDIDPDGLAATVELVRASGGHIDSYVADVGDREALEATLGEVVASTGVLHGVFANAGVLPSPRRAGSFGWGEWDRVIAVNLTGAMHTLVGCLGAVADGGSLLVSGSSLAIRPREQRLAYVAAKAGLHAAARALALELAGRRIRVNVLAPGLTDTPMVHRIPGHVETGLPGVPLGELVDPDEVAAMAVHLLSDEARHITGAVLAIDGGRTTA